MALLLLFPVFARKQAKPVYTDEQIQSICDSVVAEGNLLYRYQKAAEIGADTALADEAVKSEYFAYVLYDAGDTMKFCAVNPKLECICQVDIVGDACVPLPPQRTRRELTPEERTIFKIRNIVHNSVVQGYYDIRIPEVASTNFVFIPSPGRYRLYLLMGSKEPDLVPFGNDYLFFANSKGRIVDWRRLHMGFLGVDINVGRRLSGAVREFVHTHPENEPFITATDICMLKLYEPKNGVQRLTILSPSLGKKMTYRTDTDKVVVTDLAAEGE